MMWSRAEIDVAVLGNLYGVKGRQRQISPGSFSAPECPDVNVLGSVAFWLLRLDVRGLLDGRPPREGARVVAGHSL